MKLKNRVSLITGSGRGIGRAMALAFAAEGATVFVNDIDARESSGTCELIKKEGGSCFAVTADVGNLDEVKEMFDYVLKTSGRIDILVNNAAILRDKTLHNMETSQHWDDVIRINLTGVFYCCREAITNMRSNNYGRIINMASVIGICGNFGQTAYSASKAGVIGFTKSLAHEGASRNITVNAIAPGFIETEMLKDIPDGVKEKIIARIPAGRLGSTSDIASLALFLASGDASYITGQVYGVNGGYLMP
ncbi:MAG: beta-ketoacyl-ACP reductase [Actinobacteria bacterium]|nr:beta-ketoacyl-ACP reductase [Actinomycetota bacterium]